MIFNDSEALARLMRVQRNTMDKKISLSMHPRNFGSDLQSRGHTSVRPPSRSSPPQAYQYM